MLKLNIGAWFVYPALSKSFKESIGINMDPPDDGSLWRLHLSKMREGDRIQIVTGDDEDDDE